MEEVVEESKQESMVSALLMVTNWLPGFGGSDTDEKLDDSTPPTEPTKREMRKKIFKYEKQLKRLDADVEKRQKEYRNYLAEGARSSSGKRHVFAIRARLEKFKAQVQELERLQTVERLAMWETARGHQELKSMLAEMDEDVDVTEIFDFDASEFQMQIDDVQADIQTEMNELGHVMDASEMSVGDVDMPMTEEIQLMDQIAAGERTVDDTELSFDAVQMASSTSEDSMPEMPENFSSELEAMNEMANSSEGHATDASLDDQSADVGEEIGSEIDELLGDNPEQDRSKEGEEDEW